tara:strand:+ start:3482 stop:3832 length:351 start_codon:yes stop_codon:yes gene_type:complete
MRYLSQIREAGFVEMTTGIMYESEGVFLAASAKEATRWAMYHHSCLYEDERGRCDPVVLKLEIPCSEMGELRPDMEQSEDFGYDEDTPWRNAMKMSGSVLFAGVIPLSWVVEVIEM